MPGGGSDDGGRRRRDRDKKRRRRSGSRSRRRRRRRRSPSSSSDSSSSGDKDRRRKARRRDGAAAASLALDSMAPGFVNSRGARIHVASIFYEASMEEVRQTFAQFGEMTDFVLDPDSERIGQHRGYGFIEYRDPAVAAQLIASPPGTVCIRGRPVRINAANNAANSLPGQAIVVNDVERLRKLGIIK
eukprot:TRINITY_DN9167_c0_g1_i1.p1 TRINITY_DN9167_c0_g1~~TRINITY_DN9167_c0_g1_i1.p1  ORF type:complete len:188 (+),score=56.54 TRINITY_DN9167_c0_g1_i1:80-643(+)